MATTTTLMRLTVLSFIAAGSSALEAEKVIDPEEIRKLLLPPPATLYDSWTDWETWTASPEIAMLTPYYRSGFDEDGRVVHVVEYGKWNLREFDQLSAEKEQEVLKFHEQHVRWAEKDGSLNNNQGIVLILDWDGFRLHHYSSVHALKTALKLFAPLLRVSHTVQYGFCINVNYAAETFISMARPFTGDLLDKLEIYGTRSENWKPVIMRRIPASQLPPKYGGSKDWKPLLLD